MNFSRIVRSILVIILVPLITKALRKKAKSGGKFANTTEVNQNGDFVMRDYSFKVFLTFAAIMSILTGIMFIVLGIYIFASNQKSVDPTNVIFCCSMGVMFLLISIWIYRHQKEMRTEYNHYMVRQCMVYNISRTILWTDLKAISVESNGKCLLLISNDTKIRIGVAYDGFKNFINFLGNIVDEKNKKMLDVIINTYRDQIYGE